MHEWAELFRRLCSKSRQEWNSHLKAISEVIMFNKTNRLILQNKITFSKEIAGLLLKHHNYLFYRFRIKLETSESLDAMIWFLDEIDIYPCDFFEEIDYELKDCEFAKIDLFFQKYLEMRFLEEKVRPPHEFEFYFTAFDIDSENFIYKHQSRLISLVKFWTYYSDDLIEFQEKLKTVEDPEILKFIEDHPLNQMQWNELILIHRRNISELEMINYSALMIDFNTLRSLVSQNLASDLRIEKCKEIFLNLFDASNEDSMEILSNLSQILDAFPNANKLIVRDLLDDVDMINKVFFTSSKEEDYRHLQKIHKLMLMKPFDNNIELRIFRYNCHIVILVDGKIIYWKAKQIKLYLRNDQYLQLDGITALVKNSKNIVIDRLIEVDWESIEVQERISDILNLIKEKTNKEAAILILESDFHSFKRNAFSQLNKSINQVELNSVSQYNYWLNIYILKDCLTKENKYSKKYFVVDEIAESDSDNKDPHQIISELQNNYVLDIFIQENVRENLILRSSPDRRKFKNENWRNVPDAFSFILICKELEKKKLRSISICSDIGNRKVLNALKRLFLVNSTISEIVLNLSSSEYVSEIFESLEHNYWIKKLVSYSSNEVGEDVVEQADQFRDKRVGLKIVLNTKHKRYREPIGSFEINKPENLFCLS
jgi:hypothetical protein